MTAWTHAVSFSQAIKIVHDNDCEWRLVVGVEIQHLNSVLALDSVDSQAQLGCINEEVEVGNKIQARPESWDFSVERTHIRERVFLRVEGQQGHVDVPLRHATASLFEAHGWNDAALSGTADGEIIYLDLLSALRELDPTGSEDE